MQIRHDLKQYILSDVEREAVEWMAKMASRGTTAHLELEIALGLRLLLEIQGPCDVSMVSMSLKTVREGLVPDFRLRLIARVRLARTETNLWSKTDMFKVVWVEEGWRLVLPILPHRLSLE